MPNLLQNHFEKFRQNTVGNDFAHPFATGKKKIVYADWAASGRLYRPIEACLADTLGPYVANTHTETTLTGTVMTHAYQQARTIIKNHVNAAPDDQLLFVGFGMTAAINKLQRILGLRVHEKYKAALLPADHARPLVIITHMEHHSNQTSWEESLCEVAIIRREVDGLPSLEHLREILQANQNRPLLIGSFTACSNVTGILTPYPQMAEIMHEFGGYCFVDFSASAPYVAIDMHPAKASQHLDAIFFSPHKFLGGPGSSGVVVFNRALYLNHIPDQPGGGTVIWTNPWGEHHFYDDIEVREDGGTPGFLQAIKGALAILLKEEMGIGYMGEREHQLKERLLDRLLKIPALHVLEPEQRQRLSFVSFYATSLHHNLIVRLLNDKFGIQTRGGCSCAGTYGHILLAIDHTQSKRITDQIDQGDLSQKPGWVRISLHPTMTDEEVEYIAAAVEEIVKYHHRWSDEYTFDHHTGDFQLLKDSEFRLDLKRIFHG